MQAFEFDSAIAYRYSLKERDQELRNIHQIVQAIRMTGRFHGHKKIKPERYKSIIADLVTLTDEDEEEEKQDPLLVKITKGSVIDNVTISRNNL